MLEIQLFAIGVSRLVSEEFGHSSVQWSPIIKRTTTSKLPQKLQDLSTSSFTNRNMET